MNIKNADPPIFPFGGDLEVLFMAGFPVKQVQMPELLNRKFLSEGVRRFVVPTEVNPDKFHDFLMALSAVNNAVGALVTVPHKEALFKASEKPSSRAAMLGFANVIRKANNGTLECDCLDGDALMNGLIANGFCAEKKSAFIVGCGGAGAAYAHALADSCASEIFLTDSNVQRAHNLAANLNSNYQNTKVNVATETGSLRCDLIINASPIGMASDNDCVFSETTIRSAAVVIDATTPKWETLLIRSAKKWGLIAIDGKQLAAFQLKSVEEYFWPT
jgi:shikimate dehydrogenase